ncbi:MAG TPA: methionyl-tRNA formyltransferase [Myxococcales bacterium]|nr:methionyl-tRNA formyltransferase [Myxococcales bacterium]
MGTPAFAVPSLEATADVCDLALVVAQPDRPQGRGRRIERPPVAGWASAHGVDLFQPTKIRPPEVLERLAALAPDVVVVAAYGKILPPSFLELPRLGCVNVHASLLPRYRGAAPIQWAIARGERETGVTLMQMEEGLDTGPILAQRRCPILPEDTGVQLTDRLALLGAALLRAELPRLERGELRATRQDDAQATLAPRLTREDGRVDWTRPARELHDRIRAFQPWPGAVCALPTGAPLKILATAVQGGTGPAGTVLAAGSAGIEVASGEGSLLLRAVQPEGGRRMTGAEFVAGHPLAPGARLG